MMLASAAMSPKAGLGPIGFDVLHVNFQPMLPSLVPLERRPCGLAFCQCSRRD
jgi:hypothetical protein